MGWYASGLRRSLDEEAVFTGTLASQAPLYQLLKSNTVIKFITSVKETTLSHAGYAPPLERLRGGGRGVSAVSSAVGDG
tara:strand:- start:137 stop:373 length:237 start_codon:yes stop_codon:yes gene_type:complete